jgi:AcrR family transcriptional regulator
VLAATNDLLAEDGFEALRVETVAARAGVHKTTVYRRWPSKASLIADAARERSRQMVPVPDTGTFAGDLRALARAIAANIGSVEGSRRTRTLVAAAATSDDVAAVSLDFWNERFELTGTIVEHAVARGELPEGTDSRLVIETLIGPMYVRLLLTGEPIDRGFADRVAALVVAGVQR